MGHYTRNARKPSHHPSECEHGYEQLEERTARFVIDGNVKAEVTSMFCTHCGTMLDTAPVEIGRDADLQELEYEVVRDGDARGVTTLESCPDCEAPVTSTVGSKQIELENGTFEQYGTRKLRYCSECGDVLEPWEFTVGMVTDRTTQKYEHWRENLSE